MTQPDQNPYREALLRKRSELLAAGGAYPLPALRAAARPLHPSDIRGPKIQQLIDDMYAS